jgi:hypothetical protein
MARTPHLHKAAPHSEGTGPQRAAAPSNTIKHLI